MEAIMRVVNLSWDCTDGTGQDVTNPSWEDVEAEIMRMDGRKYTMVAMSVNSTHNLIIGGGGEQYTLGLSDGENCYLLKNENGSADNTVWIVCGQETDYPEDEVVKLEDVLQAARFYFERCKPDQSLQWKVM